MNIRFVCVFALALLARVSMLADFNDPNIEKVPLYRLIQNLEKQKDEDPTDPHAFYAIGRLYAMAFVKRTDSVDAIHRVGEEFYLPFYGYEKNLPHFFQIRTKADTSRKNFAKECLDRAIENFKTAVKLDSTYIPSLLGLGWSYQHAGDSLQAERLYRTIIRRAAKTEKDDYISIETAETANYLLQLLDPRKDSLEIVSLSRKVKDFKPNYLISPLLIPLEENLSLEQLVDTTASVAFDLDGSGGIGNWEWTSKKAGWLVYTPKGKEISDGMQLFGNRTFNVFWKNGFDALAVLDDNGDGKINGEELLNLSVWTDQNKDGKSEPSELRSLGSLSIESFTYKYTTLSTRVLKAATGIQYKDGHTSALYDWYARRKLSPL